MRAHKRGRFLALLLLSCVAAACDDDNPFRSIDEEVLHGDSQVWELGLEGFPSGFDIPSGGRFFVGASTVASTFGTFVLDARADGTLVFRPYSTLAPVLSGVRTGIQDLGTGPFSSITQVPDGGYNPPSDSLGVPVLEGHTYAFRISISNQAVIPINYAKLHVIDVGQQFPDDPRSRFIRFEWAYQRQPLNRNVAVEEGGGS